MNLEKYLIIHATIFKGHNAKIIIPRHFHWRRSSLLTLCYFKGLDKHAPYVRPPNCPSPKLEAMVIWDDREFCYRAEQLENRQVRGYGFSMEEAIKNLKVSHNFRLMLVRLAAGCEV